MAGPEYESLQGCSPLPPAIAEELFGYELSDEEDCVKSLNPDTKGQKKATVTIDNLMSPAHTLLQIQCVDQKGLFYDILRTSKECNIQVTFHNSLLISVPFHFRCGSTGLLDANHVDIQIPQSTNLLFVRCFSLLDLCWTVYHLAVKIVLSLDGLFLNSRQPVK